MQADKYIFFLLEQAQQGNRNKFLEFCELYYEEIFKIIYKLAPNNEFASNLTVEVFTTAYNNLRLISLEANFTFWLKSLAIRLTLQALKENKNKSLPEDSFHEEYLKIESSSFKNVLSNYFKLPNHFRVAVILFLQEGYEIKDIKELLLQLFNFDEDNFLEQSLEKLLENSDYSWLLDLDLETFQKVNNALKKNSFVSLEDKEELIQDLIQRFNIFFRKVDTPADIPLKIKKFLLEDSTISAEKKKTQTKLFLELQKEVEASKKAELQKEEIKLPKKKSGKSVLKLLLFALILSGLYYYKFIYNDISWKSTTNSYVIVGGEKIKFDNLNEGDKFSVQGEEPLKLFNSIYGKLIAYKGTNLIISAESKNQSIITIFNGSISINSNRINGQYKSIIKGNKFIIKDFGSEFTLEVNNTTKGVLRVKEGTLIFKINKKEFLLSEGVSILFNGNDFSIPFHYSTNRSLQEACKDYMLSNDINSFYNTFKRERKVSDTSTLWALYILSSGDLRKEAAKIVYDEFNMPENVTLNDLINAKEETLIKLEKEFMWQLY